MAPVTKPSKLSPETQEEGRARHWLDQPGKRLGTATSHVMVLLDVCAGLRTKLAALEAERPVSVEAVMRVWDAEAEWLKDRRTYLYDDDRRSFEESLVAALKAPSTPLPEVESLVRRLDDLYAAALAARDDFDDGAQNPWVREKWLKAEAAWKTEAEQAWPTLSAALLQRKR